MNYRNIRNTFSKVNDSNEKKAKNKKEILQKKLLQQQKNAKEIQVDVQNSNDNEQTDYKQLYRKLNKNYEKVESKVEELEERIKLNSLKERELLNSNNILKEQLFEANRHVDGIKILEKNLSKLELKIDEKEQILLSKDKEIDNLKETIVKLTKKIKQKDNTNDQLRKVNQYLKEDVNIEIKYHKNAHISIKAQNNKLRERNQELLNSLEKYENLDPNGLLKELYDNLTVKNFHQFKFVQALSRKLSSIRYQYYKIRDNTDDYEDVQEIFGIIKEQDSIYYFSDLENNLYTIKPVHKFKIKDGDPVVARIIGEKEVEIFWKYYSKEEMDEDIDQNGKKDKNKELINQGNIFDEPDYDYIGEYKVAIITASKNGWRYKKRLKAHGLDAFWIDAYEKSPVHVKEIMDSSDIVLLCVDSMPHTVNNTIDKENAKYQFLVSHSEDIVVARVRYTLEQLGLPSSE